MTFDSLRNMKMENTYSKGVDISILKIFDDDYYAKLAYEDKNEYEAIGSLTHLEFGNFSLKNNANTLSTEFLIVKKQVFSFKFHDYKHISRYFLEDTRHFSENIRLFSAAISSSSFLLFLGILTEIKSLIATPYFMGGGTMMTGSGV